jgi:hypothetical protein
MRPDPLTAFDNRPGMLHISLGVTGMIRFAFCVSICSFFSMAYADSATQTDWSGGPGTPGPVLSWGDDFSFDTGTSWSTTPGTAGITPGGIVCLDSTFSGACALFPCDIDGSGSVDIVAVSSLAGGVAWWDNVDGSGQIWVKHVLCYGFGAANSVFCGDVDGDGDLDIAAAAGGMDDRISWWENVGGSGDAWTEHYVATLFDGASAVSLGDFNNDGSLDVVGCSSYDDRVMCWENHDGTGDTWIAHLVASGFVAPLSVDAGDIDNDGTLDVLCAGSFANEIAWWENANGSGSVWIKHSVDPDFPWAYSARLADFDADGDLDVFGASFFDNIIACWENDDGSGTCWTERGIDLDFAGANAVNAADVDQDGDIDVVGVSHNGDELAWWENEDGLGHNWSKHSVWPFDGADFAGSGDFDGDAGMDIACCGGDVVAWCDLNEYPESASLESSILYTGCDPDWGTLIWTALTPPGTAASFQIRASDDYTQMGMWSDTLAFVFSLHGILADNASFVQYRAILTTTDPDATPTLLDVTVTWDPLGTGEGEGPSTFELLPFSPNPISGPIVVSFGLPSAAVAGFSVFDVSGRVVFQAPATEYPAGYQQIQLGELAPGIYICRMRAGEFEATQRFAIVE